MEKMNQIKRVLGLLWMAAGPAIVVLLAYTAFSNISAGGTGDIHKPLPWAIIIFIFTPIAIGLSIFGWYAWKGEYDQHEN
jgi:hypothetical protein